MKLTTLKIDSEELAALYTADGFVTLDTLNRYTGSEWPTGMYELIREGLLDGLTEWYRNGGCEQLVLLPTLACTEAEFAPLYRKPNKIWGIGMNYVADPSQLELMGKEEEPVGFMKPTTTLIGPGDKIIIPPDAGTITAEAELAIVIGKECRCITEDEAVSVVAGFTTALDMTAADIHERNPRFLTRAKSYDTFLSIGPQFITVDEIDNVLDLKVSTVLNEQLTHQNKVFNMRYRPWFTVAFHSAFMTLLPGDIILTGTPGSVVIREGDQVQCRIDGFAPLCNRAAV